MTIENLKPLFEDYNFTTLSKSTTCVSRDFELLGLPRLGLPRLGSLALASLAMGRHRKEQTQAQAQAQAGTGKDTDTGTTMGDIMTTDIVVAR